jgi:hypothetical protein
MDFPLLYVLGRNSVHLDWWSRDLKFDVNSWEKFHRCSARPVSQHHRQVSRVAKRQQKLCAKGAGLAACTLGKQSNSSRFVLAPAAARALQQRAAKHRALCQLKVFAAAVDAD